MELPFSTQLCPITIVVTVPRVTEEATSIWMLMAAMRSVLVLNQVFCRQAMKLPEALSHMAILELNQKVIPSFPLLANAGAVCRREQDSRRSCGCVFDRKRRQSYMGTELTGVAALGVSE